MAITDLSNLYTPQVWGSVLAEKLPNVSRLFQSGAIDNNSAYAQFVGGPGSVYTIPILRPLSGRSQVLSANNTPQAGAVSSIIPQANSTGLMKVVRHQRAQGWAWKELAMTIAGLDNALGARSRGFGMEADVTADPVGFLEGMLMDYWAADMQSTLVRVLKGVFANATMLAEHLLDFTLQVSGSATAVNRISVASIVAGQQLLGDNREKLSVIVMHSLQYSKLLTDNLITFLKLDQDLEVPTVAGLRVVVDDAVDVIPAAAGVPAKYACYMMGAGSVAYAPIIEDTPLEVARDAAAGVDTLYNRMGFVLQPKGISWAGSLADGEFPTDAQLIVGTNYARSLDRKNVPLICLLFN
jgi:hypothetical protein